MRAWGKKKQKKTLQIPIYGDVNHDRVISQSCLLPQHFCKLSLRFCATPGPRNTQRRRSAASHGCSYLLCARQMARAGAPSTFAAGSS